PAPHNRRVLLDEVADRHRLDSARRLGRNDLAFAVYVRLDVHAQHARDRVPVHVAVEGTGLVTLRLESRGEVGGPRRLADTALAGGDADHVLHLGQRAGRQSVAAEGLLESGLFLVGKDVEADPDRGDA